MGRSEHKIWNDRTSPNLDEKRKQECFTPLQTVVMIYWERKEGREGNGGKKVKVRNEGEMIE